MNITTEVKPVTIETKVLHVELTEEEGDLIKGALDKAVTAYSSRRGPDTDRRKLTKILAAFKLALDPQDVDEDDELLEEEEDGDI